MPTLHELLTICGRPSYVKVAAEQPPLAEIDRDSREGVYLQYVTKLAANEPVQGLHDLGRFWSISGDLKTAADRWAAHNTTVEPTDDDFALVVQHQGEQIRKFAAYDAPSTVRAANAFYENRCRYPYEWRKVASERLLERQERFGAVIPRGVHSYLVKAAGLAGFTQESLEDAIRARYVATPRAKIAGFTKLAEVLNVVAASPEFRHDREMVDTALRVMDVFDHDLPAGHTVKLAEESLEVLDVDLMKCAEDMLADHVTLQNGRIVKLSSLTEDALQAVSPELTKMSADELRDVLPTLPRPDADLLTRLI